MTLTYKILGQVAPVNTATTATLYTVPGIRLGAVISSVTICNQGLTATSFSIALVPSGGTLTTSSYINYLTPLPGYDTVTMAIGITMATGDNIYVGASTYPVSFSAFGSEVS
jgi:hypothetical protein